jgi:hypothetical protein
MRYADKGRQVRRDAAVARPELRSAGKFFNVADRLPDEERKVTARAKDNTGDYTIPFAVYRRGETWHNAKSHTVLEVQIIGWRYL